EIEQFGLRPGQKERREGGFEAIAEAWIPGEEIGRLPVDVSHPFGGHRVFVHPTNERLEAAAPDMAGCEHPDRKSVFAAKDRTQPLFCTHVAILPLALEVQALH